MRKCWQANLLLLVVLGLAPSVHADASAKQAGLDGGLASEGTAQVRGRVLITDYKHPLAAGRVALIETNTGEQRISLVKDDGAYEFTGVHRGIYMLRAEATGLGTTEQGPINVGDHVTIERDVVLEPVENPPAVVRDRGEPWGWAIAALIAFLIGSLFTRWFKIAKPSHHHLEHKIESVYRQVTLELDALGSNSSNERQVLDKMATALWVLKSRVHPKGWAILKHFFFWSQSKENALWGELHVIEADFTGLRGTDDLVTAQLTVAEPALRSLQSECAKALADEIKTARLSGETQENRQLRRKLLSQGMLTIFDARDEHFKSLTDWQNKASWLLVVAMLLMVVVGAVFGNLMLFVAGAAGGLLSRMMRAVRQPEFAVDYGASWTTLFLSPVFGALGAWFMIGVIHLLTNSQVAVLGGVFKAVQWGQPLSLHTLSIAFLLGFSERYFDSVVEAANGAASKEPPASKPAPAAGAAAPTSSVLERITLEAPPSVQEKVPVPVRAWGTFADGARVDISMVAKWSSSSEEIAKVTSDQATGVTIVGQKASAEGVTISASWLGLKAQAKTTVKQ